MELTFFGFMVLLLLLNNPLLLILYLIFVLIIFILVLSFLLNSYFYSYVVFLLFVSGLMMLFMYISSVVLNEKFIYDLNFFAGALVLIYGYFNTADSGINIINSIFVYFDFYNLIKFFLFSVNFLSLFFFIYLFFCLMIVYEILKCVDGPMRVKF